MCGRPDPRAPKYIRYDTKLQAIVDSFDGYIDILEFSTAIGNLVALVIEF